MHHVSSRIALSSLLLMMMLILTSVEMDVFSKAIRLMNKHINFYSNKTQEELEHTEYSMKSNYDGHMTTRTLRKYFRNISVPSLLSSHGGVSDSKRVSTQLPGVSLQQLVSKSIHPCQALIFSVFYMHVVFASC